MGFWTTGSVTEEGDDWVGRRLHVFVHLHVSCCNHRDTTRTRFISLQIYSTLLRLSPSPSSIIPYGDKPPGRGRESANPSPQEPNQTFQGQLQSSSSLLLPSFVFFLSSFRGGGFKDGNAYQTIKRVRLLRWFDKDMILEVLFCYQWMEVRISVHYH